MAKNTPIPDWKQTTSGIYQILNTVTGDFYIGRTSNFKQRWHTHRSLLRRNIHTNSYLQHAWNKYGEAAFQFVILEQTTQTVERETYWLERLKPVYNLDYAAIGSIKHTEETKQRIKAANKGQVPWSKGKTHVEISGAQKAAERREAFVKMSKEHPKPGDTNPNAKLTWEQVREIRRVYGPPTRFGRGKKPRVIDLAQRYGISEHQISRIIHYECFREEPPVRQLPLFDLDGG